MKQNWWIWLFTWQGRIGRLPYFVVGLILAATKYLADNVVAASFGARWPLWNYVNSPLPIHALLRSSPLHTRMYLTLWAVAVPFFWIGIALTLRRLRDAGRRGGWVFLLFVPYGNLVLFLWMALAPSASAESDSDGVIDQLSTLTVPVVLAAGIGLLLVSVDTMRFLNYGFALFLGVPFTVGFIASWLLQLTGPRDTFETILASIAPVVVIGVSLIGLRMEGVICLVMALPLAIPFALAGGFTARDFVLRQRRAKGKPLAACVTILPLLMFIEYTAHFEPAVAPVTTSVVIHAPASVVWKNVIGFPPLAPPSLASPKDWIFFTGIAYPAVGRIVGSGVGAVRYCQFSTGNFVEPITVWDENRLLAFNVSSEPPAMHELSPWEIHAPHLERNYMRSQHGQFKLVALDDHTTLLEGTTWYQNYFWPQMYWRGWSDMIVHRIHMRVLEHVKEQAEAAAR